MSLPQLDPLDGLRVEKERPLARGGTGDSGRVGGVRGTGASGLWMPLADDGRQAYRLEEPETPLPETPVGA